jgi:hypothetical protein
VPAPFTQRVPTAFARALFQRWNQAGELPVLISWIWDRYDWEKSEIEALLERKDVTTPEVVSEVRKRQGALAMLQKLARALELEGQPETSGNGRPDALDTRPPTRHGRKRPPAAF